MKYFLWPVRISSKETPLQLSKTRYEWLHIRLSLIHNTLHLEVILRASGMLFTVLLLRNASDFRQTFVSKLI